MIKISRQDNQGSNNVINQVLYKYKSRFKRAFIYSSIGNVLFLIVTIYSLQVLDRIIGSGNPHPLALILVIIGIILLFYFICSLLSYILTQYSLKDLDQWLYKENLLYLSLYPSGTVSEDVMQLKSFLFNPPFSITLDAIWSIFYFMILCMIHPYIGFSAIVAASLVAGFAYIKLITTNRPIIDVTEFDSKEANWYYLIQQIGEPIIIILPLSIPIILLLTLIYSCFKFYTFSKAFNQSNYSYSNNMLPKTYMTFKEWVTIIIKFICSSLITGVGAYIIVSTNGQELTTGGMIASSIITLRVLISADNIVLVQHNIKNAYKSYLNLARLVQVTN